MMTRKPREHNYKAHAPLTLCANPKLTYPNGQSRCQAAVEDKGAWRQCKRIAVGILAFCPHHSHPDRKVNTEKVTVKHD